MRPSVMVRRFSAGTYFGRATALVATARPSKMSSPSSPADLGHRPDLAAVGGVDLPAGADHEPGNGVAHSRILTGSSATDEYPQRRMLSPSVDNLVAQLTRLPGIGSRTAQRLAFHLLQRPKEEALALAAAIEEVKERVRFCRECGNLTEEELCAICLDARRDRTTICVVEQPVDLVSLERTARVPRPLPRARRRALPARRRRARAPAHRRAHPPRRGERRRRGRPRDEPERRPARRPRPTSPTGCATGCA